MSEEDKNEIKKYLLIEIGESITTSNKSESVMQITKYLLNSDRNLCIRNIEVFDYEGEVIKKLFGEVCK